MTPDHLSSVRWIARALLVAVGVWAAADSYMPFWVDGVGVIRVAAGVPLLVAVPLALSGTMSVLLRRRNTASWAVYLFALGDAVWAAFVAGLAFSLSDLAAGEPAGWGLALIAFGSALVVLTGAWWAEDRLAAS